MVKLLETRIFDFFFVLFKKIVINKTKFGIFANLPILIFQFDAKFGIAVFF